MANQRKTPTPSSGIPLELTHFDQLPDSAHVRLPVVRGLFGNASPPTIYRAIKRGTIPAPVRLSENISAWNVGQLRKALAARAS